MILTYTVKIYPNKQQAERLDLWLWQCRRLYNAFLEQRVKCWKRRKQSVSFYDQSARIKQWRAADGRMKDTPAVTLRDTAARLDKAFKAFFRRCKSGETPGFPRFKARNRFRCLEFNQPRDLRNLIGAQQLIVPKLGRIRCRGLRDIIGSIRSLRMVRKASGWFAFIAVDDGLTATEKKPVDQAVGVDVGLESFAVGSDGSVVENPRYLRRSLDRLARLQRKLSRTKKGSSNRRKAANRLARLHERVDNCRKNFLHHASKSLVQKFDLIAVEDLNIVGMARGHFAKSIHDAGWGRFINYLGYKAERAGVTVVKVNARNTSQECSACGRLVPKLVSDRFHRCPCGFEASRDLNAAINVLHRALPPVGRDVTLAEDARLLGPPLKQVGS